MFRQVYLERERGYPISLPTPLIIGADVLPGRPGAGERVPHLPPHGPEQAGDHQEPTGVLQLHGHPTLQVGMLMWMGVWRDFDKLQDSTDCRGRL